VRELSGASEIPRDRHSLANALRDEERQRGTIPFSGAKKTEDGSGSVRPGVQFDQVETTKRRDDQARRSQPWDITKLLRESGIAAGGEHGNPRLVQNRGAGVS